MYKRIAGRSLPGTDRSGLMIPFVRTTPLEDVGLLMLLVPLWWFLGIEQFIWPIGLLLPAWKVIRRKRGRPALNRTLQWLLVFIGVHLVSGLFVVETFRWITFVRNLSAYVATALLLLTIFNEVSNWTQIQYLLKAIIAVMLLASVAGLLGVFGIGQAGFTSLAGVLLPDWIKATTYGGAISHRVIGQGSYFTQIGQYFRVSSFFLFATMFAAALAMTFPFAVFFLGQAKRPSRRVSWLLIAILLLANLALTTGRMAILGLGAGALYYAVVHSRYRRPLRWVFLAAALVAITLLVIDIIWPGRGLVSFGEQAVQTALYARGGSVDDRNVVYQKTLEGFRLRPLFGWGTERDIAESQYPAGSHSYYLGILYKQGALGLIVFLAMLWSLWRETAPLSRPPPTVTPQLANFLRMGRWVLVVVLLNSLTEVMDLDMTTMMVAWLGFSLLITANRLCQESLQSEEPQKSVY